MTRFGKYATIVVLALALPAPALANEVHYFCDGGTQLIATFSAPGASPGSVVLAFPAANAKITLPQLKSADGARYGTRPGAEVILSGKDGKKVDANVEFWIRGRDATLTRNGRSEKCQSK